MPSADGGVAATSTEAGSSNLELPCEDGTFRVGRFPALRYRVLGDPLLD